RTLTPLGRGTVYEDRVVEVELRQILDGPAVLLRIHVVPVVHRPEARFVPRGVAGDQEGPRGVEEGDASPGVARREDDLQSVDLLAVVEEDVHGGSRVVLRPGRSVVHALARDEVRFGLVRGDCRGRSVC